MSCTIGQNVIVCGPPPGVYTRRVLDCHACKRRHRFVVRWDGAWYGTTEYGSCGDAWVDGWRMERPFRRGWRDEARAKFRAMWESAAPRDLYDAYVWADCELARMHGDDPDADAAAVRALDDTQSRILALRAAAL